MTERQREMYGAELFANHPDDQPGKPTYIRVGPPVATGDVRISKEDGRAFQQLALLGTKIHRLSLDDDTTAVWANSYASGILSTMDADNEVYENAVFSKSIEGPGPYWRSVVNFVRYNQKHADTKIYNIFDVSSRDGEVSSAIRHVRVVRNLTRIAFNEETGEPYDDNYSRQRRTYQTAMEPEDIGSVALRIERIMNRQKVTSRR